MKRTAILTILILMVATALQAGSWTGWITDEHCGDKGAKSSHKSCALKCAGDGTPLVFYNTADKKIYKIDKQELAKAHLGSEVVVTGEADGDSIKVASIEDSKPAK